MSKTNVKSGFASAGKVLIILSVVTMMVLVAAMPAAASSSYTPNSLHNAADVMGGYPDGNYVGHLSGGYATSINDQLDKYLSFSAPIKDGAANFKTGDSVKYLSETVGVAIYIPNTQLTAKLLANNENDIAGVTNDRRYEVGATSSDFALGSTTGAVPAEVSFIGGDKKVVTYVGSDKFVAWSTPADAEIAIPLTASRLANAVANF